MYYEIFDTPAILALDFAKQIEKGIPRSSNQCNQRAIMDFGKYALLPKDKIGIRNVCFPRQ